jgi:uncharacterized membrane-anchored protein YhcB (DUF1043 family)
LPDILGGKQMMYVILGIGLTLGILIGLVLVALIGTRKEKGKWESEE